MHIHPSNNPRLPRRSFLLVTASASLPLAAQPAGTSHSPNVGPFRTSTEGGEHRLMLEGHDAVAYFVRKEAVRGEPGLSLEHQGVVWRFASDAYRTAFAANPKAYMPQFGGFCSNGINYAIPWGGGGGPNSWRIYRGRLYVFGGQKARDHFEMDTELNLQRAHQYWNDEVAGANPLVTRWRRLVFRVPHYMSDTALQAQWESMRSAGTLPVMPGGPQVVPPET
jgi:YHS domain-containing protein